MAGADFFVREKYCWLVGAGAGFVCERNTVGWMCRRPKEEKKKQLAAGNKWVKNMNARCLGSSTWLCN